MSVPGVLAAAYPIVVEFATPGSSAFYAWQARQPGGDGHMYNENGVLWEALTDEERATWEHVAQQAHEAHLPCSPDRHVYPDEIDEDPPDEESATEPDDDCSDLLGQPLGH